MSKEKPEPIHHLISWAGWIITLTILSATSHCMVDNFLSNRVMETADTCEAQAGLITGRCMNQMIDHDMRIACMREGVKLLRACNVQDPETAKE